MITLLILVSLVAVAITFFLTKAKQPIFTTYAISNPFSAYFNETISKSKNITKETLTIAFASDVHSEFYADQRYWIPPLPGKCDVYILAGDLGVGDQVIHLILRIANAVPDTDIIWIAGNHEFYGCNIDLQIKRYKNTCKDMKRIHFLENDFVDIKGFRFLGCTLWSGFNACGQENISPALKAAKKSISDFHYIRTGDDERRFTPRHAVNRYRESYRWLNQHKENYPSEKTIVITHFPPSLEVSHKKFSINILTPYFQANCDNLIKKHNPKLWVYGHNHWSDDIKIGETRVVSNQLGYPQEAGYIPKFKTHELICVN
jgi:Icc-related predicted phosphoesterase